MLQIRKNYTIFCRSSNIVHHIARANFDAFVKVIYQHLIQDHSLRSVNCFKPFLVFTFHVFYRRIRIQRRTDCHNQSMHGSSGKSIEWILVHLFHILTNCFSSEHSLQITKQFPKKGMVFSTGFHCPLIYLSTNRPVSIRYHSRQRIHSGPCLCDIIICLFTSENFRCNCHEIRSILRKVLELLIEVIGHVSQPHKNSLVLLHLTWISIVYIRYLPGFKHLGSALHYINYICNSLLSLLR